MNFPDGKAKAKCAVSLAHIADFYFREGAFIMLYEFHKRCKKSCGCKSSSHKSITSFQRLKSTRVGRKTLRN